MYILGPIHVHDVHVIWAYLSVRAEKPTGQLCMRELPFVAFFGQLWKNHRDSLTLNDAEMALSAHLLNYM